VSARRRLNGRFYLGYDVFEITSRSDSVLGRDPRRERSNTAYEAGRKPMDLYAIVAVVWAIAAREAD
jgi:hypothetical protein